MVVPMGVAAKKGDTIIAIDTHDILTASSAKVPVLHPFSGIINDGLSSNVNIMGQPAAVVGSKAQNIPVHLPIGGSFVSPPSNKATITNGSKSVFINGKAAVRNGDKAQTCNDPSDSEVGTVVAVGTVNIGG